MYVPPSPDTTYFCALLDCIHPVADSSDVIILGDFNCPDINWASLAASTGPSKMLCDFAFSYNLCQVVDSPTHVKGNTLDLIFVHSPLSIPNLTVNSNWSLFPFSSDHFPITFTLNCSFNSTPHSSSSSFQFHKGDYTGLQDHLLDTDFSPYFSSVDIDFLWDHLKSTILEACHKFIPMASCSTRYPRWFTGNIRHQLN